jgi:ATP-dependent Zn protease
LNPKVIKLALGLGILSTAIIAYFALDAGRNTQTILSYEQLDYRITSKEVKRAEIGPAAVTGELSNGEEFRTYLSNPTAQAQVAEHLRANGANVRFESTGNSGLLAWLAGLIQEAGPALVLFAFVLLPAFWVWMIVDCALKEPPGPDKIVWILIILLGNVIGAAIYFVVRRSGRGHGTLSATN